MVQVVEGRTDIYAAARIGAGGTTTSTRPVGGAVARSLLERGHKVRAVTREPNSSQAELLANAEALLVAASLEDTAAITKALEGATSSLRD